MTDGITYIDKADLADLVREYNATGAGAEEIGRCILRIAGGVLSGGSWRDYSTAWRDDMLSESVSSMWRAVEGGKVRPTGAWSYLTTVCVNACRRMVGFCKARQAGLQGYQEWAGRSGLAVSENNIDDAEADAARAAEAEGLYDYCVAAGDSMA